MCLNLNVRAMYSLLFNSNYGKKCITVLSVIDCTVLACVAAIAFRSSECEAETTGKQKLFMTRSEGSELQLCVLCTVCAK